MPMTQEDIYAHYQKAWAARSGSDDPATALVYSNEIEDGVVYPAYEDLIRRCRIRVEGGRVLDVGAGSGRWVRFFLERFRPRHVTGIDFTPASIELLRRHCVSSDVELDFRVADITAGAIDLGSFDLVNVGNVLFHIPEEDRFRSALRNLATCLAEDGAIVTTEFLPRCSMRTEWMLVRDRYAFEEAVAAAGLRVCEVCAASFFASEPMGLDGPDEGARRLFNAVRGRSRRLLTSSMDDDSRAFVLSLLVDVERAALAFTRERVADVDGPGKKLVVLRKT